MRWQTKNSLRIENARLQTQAECLIVQLRERNEYVTKLERLIDKERERIDHERERADRAGDALLQQNGIAPISTLGAEQSAAATEEAEKEMKELSTRMGQFYADALDDIESDEEISPEIKTVLSGVEEVIR